LPEAGCIELKNKKSELKNEPFAESKEKNPPATPRGWRQRFPTWPWVPMVPPTAGTSSRSRERRFLKSKRQLCNCLVKLKEDRP
jgi:hypothetical protein